MRYLPHTEEDVKTMLSEIGVTEINELFEDIPKSIIKNTKFDLPDHKSEIEVERYMTELSKKNIIATEVPFFIGAGSYNHHIPAAVDHIIQRGEFLTSYTPYQPEISQGTLQSLYEFQTQVAMITGMEIANSSMYDGSTASAEAVLMATRITRRKNVIISEGVHPQWVETINTFTKPLGINLSKIKKQNLANFDENFEEIYELINTETACVVIQNPDFFGNIGDFKKLAQRCHKHDALLVVCINEILSLGLIEPPGELGADIVVCEGQSLGVGLSFGGPYVGLFATHKKFVRNMTGRIVGQTLDKNHKTGWVLTLNTREQHIRREKATSNICTNSGLCALAFSVHLALLGNTGFKKLATENHYRAIQLFDYLKTIKKIKLLNKSFFNEFSLELPSDASIFVDYASKKGVLAGLPADRLFHLDGRYKNILVLAVTELNTKTDMNALIKIFKDYFK